MSLQTLKLASTATSNTPFSPPYLNIKPLMTQGWQDTILTGEMGNNVSLESPSVTFYSVFKPVSSPQRKVTLHPWLVKGFISLLTCHLLVPLNHNALPPTSSLQNTLLSPSYSTVIYITSLTIISLFNGCYITVQWPLNPIYHQWLISSLLEINQTFWLVL